MVSLSSVADFIRPDLHSCIYKQHSSPPQLFCASDVIHHHRICLPITRIHSHSDSASGAMGLGLGTDLLLDSNALSDKPQPQTASIAGNQQQHQDQDATTVKKANMRMLIERYFYQLLEGCADQSCQNINCKSSGKVPILTPNQAAAKALQLFFQGASLCPKPGEGKQDTKLPTAMQTKNGIALNGESSSDNPSNNKPNCDKTERVTSMDQNQRQEQDQDRDER